MRVSIHTVAMFAVMGIIAIVVFEKIGLVFLRLAWFNLDRVWAIVLIGPAALTLALWQMDGGEGEARVAGLEVVWSALEFCPVAYTGQCMRVPSGQSLSGEASFGQSLKEDQIVLGLASLTYRSFPFVDYLVNHDLCR